MTRALLDVVVVLVALGIAFDTAVAHLLAFLCFVRGVLPVGILPSSTRPPGTSP